MSGRFYSQPTPNPKHALTFACLSAAILLVPLFWSPLEPPTLPEPRASVRAVELAAGSTASPRPEITQASESSDYSAPRRDPVLDFSYYLRRMVLALLATIIVMAITLKLLQKHLSGWASGQPANKLLHILARETMGPNQSLALVKIGPKVLLVGLSEQSMNSLCELDESQLTDLLEAPTSGTQPPNPGKVYSGILRHYLGLGPKSEPNS